MSIQQFVLESIKRHLPENHLNILARRNEWQSLPSDVARAAATAEREQKPQPPQWATAAGDKVRAATTAEHEQLPQWTTVAANGGSAATA